MINVRPNNQSPASYKADMERIINEKLETDGMVSFPIRMTMYHNNGAKIYPIEVCRDIAREMKSLGYYCYFERPSYNYDQMTDFVISSKPRTRPFGNLEIV